MQTPQQSETKRPWIGGHYLGLGQDFHTLSHAQIDNLLAEADRVRYRKPKNANGSRARYFHAHLERTR
jgi:hypothetical protein